MATDHESPTSRAEFVDILLVPPKVSREWASFSLFVVDATPLRAKAAFPDHALAVYTSGRHRLRGQIGGRSVEGWTDPGTTNLIPMRVESAFEATGPSRGIVLFIPDVFLSRVIAEHWEADPRNVEIRPQFLTRDPVIEGVVRRLAFEVTGGGPSGQLYCESACEFLAHHLIHSCSSLSTSGERAIGGLPGRSLTMVLDYVEENLAQPIALRDLAELARVSIRHFERAFRQSVNMPPHTYVLKKRIERARQLLMAERELSVEDVATRVGFSSRSHLASAFRRQTGHSPTVFRQLNDGSHHSERDHAITSRSAVRT